MTAYPTQKVNLKNIHDKKKAIVRTIVLFSDNTIEWAHVEYSV